MAQTKAKKEIKKEPLERRLIRKLLQKAAAMEKSDECFQMIELIIAEVGRPQALIDWVVVNTLRRQQWPNCIFVDAYQLSKLGASNKVYEKVLAELIRAGWDHQALEIAGIIGRKLTQNEIMRIIRVYTNGACHNENQEQRLFQLIGSLYGARKAEAYRLVRDFQRSLEECIY